ncbi:hypothetical protein JCM18750_05920 [Halostagnicola bangensis]
MVSAEEGTNYDDELGPVIEEIDGLSKPLGEVWTDEFPAYQAMENEHRPVLHDEEYVLEDGVHTNQTECLWPLLQPWFGTDESAATVTDQLSAHLFQNLE